MIPAEATRTTLATTTKVAIGLWAAVAVALFVGFALSPVTLPRWFGSATIVLVALLGWTIFGSFALVLLPKSLGLPSLAVLLPLALVIGSSAFNDNHAPREATRTLSNTILIIVWAGALGGVVFKLAWPSARSSSVCGRS